VVVLVEWVEDVDAEVKMNEISESSGIKIKKKYMYGLVIIIIIVAGFYFFNNSSAGVNGNAVNNVNYY